MKQSNHRLWHHLVMIMVSEVVNFLWFLAGVVLIVGGAVIVTTLISEAFFTIVVGLPMLLIGVSVALFKIHEIILVIVRPKRLEAMCIFCQNSKMKP